MQSAAAFAIRQARRNQQYPPRELPSLQRALHRSVRLDGGNRLLYDLECVIVQLLIHPDFSPFFGVWNFVTGSVLLLSLLLYCPPARKSSPPKGDRKETGDGSLSPFDKLPGYLYNESV